MTERSRRGKTSDAPRSNRARAVAEMVPDIGGLAFRRFGFVQSSIVSRWAEIVGEKFATVSTPESIRFPQGKKADGVLTLTVATGHAPMMQHVTPAIMERINRFFGYSAVARVSIRQGVVATPVVKRAAPPSLRPVSAEMGESLRMIGDPELRDVLSALASAVEASTGAPRFKD